jgi:hypothetical protein
MDSLGQLQAKVLELSEAMFNGLGLVQRNAAPVRFDEDAPSEAVPLSVGEAEVKGPLT